MEGRAFTFGSSPSKFPMSKVILSVNMLIKTQKFTSQEKVESHLYALSVLLYAIHIIYQTYTTLRLTLTT